MLQSCTMSLLARMLQQLSSIANDSSVDSVSTSCTAVSSSAGLSGRAAVSAETVLRLARGLEAAGGPDNWAAPCRPELEPWT
jgi:hypothetical protein